ncbi:uncharacterized protein LOC132114900 [Carassius carassius]|uniref:uncharacterized protein LOC132114900 n=1 Tax=Carassius carassius TaxID=217509 RepID=UPI002869253D|nr:uncharacterized protein LOC132114900 [Carassius carassius]
MAASYNTRKIPDALNLTFSIKDSEHAFYNTCRITDALNSITPIEYLEHFMVSAFIDHRLNGVIRAISIISRNSVQPLYCVYCSTEQVCKTVYTNVQIHRDHFGIPFHVLDVICKDRHMQNTTPVLISTKDSGNNCMNIEYGMNIFMYNFTVCISTLFGNYNNALQFAQSVEMYKLLGVQHVIIYKTSCDRNNIDNPKNMTVNPRKMQQTSSTLT